MDRHFSFGRRTGVPRAIGGVQVTPESLVLILRLGSFGYVWNWPLAVTVTRPAAIDRPLTPDGKAAGGLVERHAIVDVTKLSTWGMGAALLFTLFVTLIGSRSLRARKRDAL
jgi:hypothetical protein